MPSWKKVITSGSSAALQSLTVTNGITGSLFGTASYALSSDTPVAVTGSTIYTTSPATSEIGTTNGIFLGENAGYQSTNSNYSVFLGKEAGYQVNNAPNSVFLGERAGYQAISANNSIFLGKNAGTNATYANNCLFIGASAGVSAENANNSFMLGSNSGNGATEAANSLFIGNASGYQATNADHSTFIGANAGLFATNASNSTFIGNSTGYAVTNASHSIYLGYKVGFNSSAIGANNTILGTNITLPAGAHDSVNIGGVIFATGTHASLSGNPYSGSAADGKVGIGVVTPTQATLEVGGNVYATSFTGSLLGNATTSTTASHALTASHINPLYQNVELHGNLVVYGTSSFNYVTSSELQVQDSYISVNVFEPAERFGGLKVYDSGSSTATASLSWDSLLNRWVYQNASGSTYSGGMLMAGPRNTGALGSEPALTQWMVARSDGGDHLDNTQIYSSGSTTQVTGSLTVTAGITGSLFGTSSWAVTSSFAVSSSRAISSSFATTASFVTTAQTASYVLNAVSSSRTATASLSNLLTLTPTLTSGFYPVIFTSNSFDGNIYRNQVSDFYFNPSTNTLNVSNVAGNASSATTASYVLNAVSASFASTASFVNTLNQNVIISGSLTVGSSSIGPSENTVTLGARDGVSEGGQIGFNAPGGTYTSASFIDNWQNKARILKGNNTTSTGLIAQWDIHTTQMNLPGYTAASSFPGTATANLAVNSNGDVITVSTTGGTVFPYTGNAVITGSLTTTGIIYAQPNGGMYFQGGDDAALYDVNVVNTMGIYGVQNSTVGAIRLGSSGPTLYGSGSSLGIGTTNPSSASLTVSGNVWATSLTGSLFGTASFTLSSSRAVSASMAVLAPSYLPLAGGTMTGDIYAAGRTFQLQDLVLGVGTTFGTIKTDGTKYIGMYPTNGVESTRFLANGSVMHGTTFTDAGYRLQVSASSAVSGALQVIGTSVITGSLSVSGGITGSLFGTSSWAVSASWAPVQVSASYATTASYVTPLVQNVVVTGSLAVSQSLLQYSNITAVTSGSTSNVASFNTSSYTAAFFDYVTTSGTNARAGSVFTVWNGNSVEYTETSTNDIGSTSNLILSASVSAGAVRLQATSLSGSWSVKTLARML